MAMVKRTWDVTFRVVAIAGMVVACSGSSRVVNEHDGGAGGTGASAGSVPESAASGGTSQLGASGHVGSFGADGVVVSNHGGRQVDGSVATLDALVEVREAVGADAVVLMDGGIRRGADVLKALALGADAVLLGRPYAYGLAVGGQEGVEAVIRHLIADSDLTLALLGAESAGGLDESWIAAQS